MRKRFTPINKLFLVFVFVMMATFSFLAFKNMNMTAATNAAYSGFQAGNIITDYVMGDYSSMSEGDIQNFLKSKNPCNDTDTSKASRYSNHRYHIENGHFVCMADERFNGESAAHIIWQAAQDYHINPRVLIVLLEKEQGLVTDTWPNADLQYRSATGYGCPDTAACDSQYYGFKNQIRNAAELFRYILDHGSKYYPVGNNYVKYNPDGNCGGSTVYIQNRATSALYQYTPYQPNNAVLNANPGTIVSCGAYGNSNFYYYYTKWFGNTRGKELDGIYLPDGIYQFRTTDGLSLSFTGTNNGANATLAPTDTNDTLQQFKISRSGKYYRFQNIKTGRYLNLYNDAPNDGTNIELWEGHNGCSQKWLVQNNGNRYRLISACASEASTKSIDVCGVATNVVGAKVQLWTDNSSNAQRWSLVNISPATVNDGTFTIQTTSKKVLTPQDEQHSAGVNMVIWENSSSKANQFSLLRSEDGSYRIINKKSGLYLAVYSAWTSNGTSAILYYKDDNTCAQRWIVERSGNSYRFTNSCSGKSLDVDSGKIDTNNRRVQIWDNNSLNAQKWNLVQSDASQAIANGTYAVSSSLRSDLQLDVIGSKNYTNGTNVHAWQRNASDNQKFKFVYDEKTGYYRIISMVNDKLSLDTSKGKVGENVQLYSNNNACSQQWILVPASDKYFYIASACTRNVLDIFGNSANNGANIGIWTLVGGLNQKWSITSSEPSKKSTMMDGKYVITSKINDNLAIDIFGGSTNVGANVGVWTTHKGPNQQFKVTYDSKSGYYTIYNEAAKQNLDIAGAIATDSTNLQIWSTNSSCAQKWDITEISNGYYRIASACNASYSLDISGASNRIGANVLLWSNHNGGNQQWKFNKI